MGDLNGDGNPDVVGTNFNDSTIYVSLGRGDGTYQSALSFEIPNRPYDASYDRILITDVTLDGAPDILFTEEPGIESVGILMVTAPGSSPASAATTWPIPSPVGLAVGDFNEDGLPDIVAGNSGANNISLLLHR